jgi:predicted PurR-regulated permease PerM
MTVLEKQNKVSLKKNESRYLKNTVLYIQMLKVDEKQVPKYKLELAYLLSNMDIFLFKLRIILSILGVFVSAGLLLILANDIYQSFFEYGFIRSFNVFIILYVYISGALGLFSYREYRRTQLELKYLMDKIETQNS